MKIKDIQKTQRRRTKKARDLIDEILKERQDTTDRRNGKEKHIQIHTTAELNTEKKRDALPLNTGKKGDAPRQNTGKKGDAV